MASTSNEDNWKLFLSSIVHFSKLPNTNSDIKIKRNTDCLSTKFACNLSPKKTEEKVDSDVSKNQTEIELTGPQTRPDPFTSDDDQRENLPVDQTDTDKDVNKASAKLANVNINGKSPRSESKHINALVSNTPLPHRKKNQSKDKDSQSNETASSKWTISSIAENLIFDECVRKFKLPTTYDTCENIYKIAQKDIFCRLQRVKGVDFEKEEEKTDNKSLIQLKSVTITEAGSRLVLDALLIPLCSALDLQIELEKNISCDLLPTCTFDYCIRKEGNIIGCVEAKSVKCLNDNSVAQAILQLMMLQATLIATETLKDDISKLSLFAIVTDGHRFIYIQLKGSFLRFEHNGNKLRIRTVTKEDDFIEILQDITCLVKGFNPLSKDDAILTDEE